MFRNEAASIIKNKVLSTGKNGKGCVKVRLASIKSAQFSDNILEKLNEKYTH